jgi:hypothetical protein
LTTFTDEIPSNTYPFVPSTERSPGYDIVKL